MANAILAALVLFGTIATILLVWIGTAERRVRLQVLFFPPDMTPVDAPILREGETCGCVLAEQVLSDGHIILKLGFSCGAHWLTYARLDVCGLESSRWSIDSWSLSREFDAGEFHNEEIQRLAEQIAKEYAGRARTLYDRLGLSSRETGEASSHDAFQLN